MLGKNLLIHTQRSCTPNVERIVESGMCIGCGLCASIAGPDVLRMGPGPDGESRPWALDVVPQNVDNTIRAVCPGVRMDLETPDPSAPVNDPMWGPLHRIAAGYAVDAETRFVASSGGGISALTQHLLDTKAVDFVLHIRESIPAPLLSTRQLSYDSVEVMRGAGSRYGTSSPLADFSDVLALGEPFAVVGKPCDIAAVRNLAKIDPRVDNLVKLTISFLCGGIGAERLEHMLDKENIDRSQITGFRCRGHGCPGPTHIDLADGSSREYPFGEFWGDDEEHWGIPFRCKVCPDAVGEQADVVAFDVWSEKTPDGELPGESGFIARSKAGLDALAAAEVDRYVAIDRELTLDELSAMQSHHVRRRQGTAPRLLAVALRNGLLPRTAWRRLLRLAVGTGVRTFTDNLRGAFTRAGAKHETMARGVPPRDWSGL
ncbi:coenzyme F420 hydrogenase [Rhodococcus sp. KBS0724]|uniref:Coenzyme F420 hydrogenase/dehydrogenase, beta subunit C-terminal domain n=1 Tax=Rhodococcus sp. KBS0724 TaxID=1179674 RepID=UPI00110DBF25|nr:Coenzyme F420 hydrogenase/dehydrogenase, beta subunit C-terminal domain [Rhodococcus sp. KBS0724]TSD40407.1 coenzyme F420 hydrogenase [Rhodococcus sp. KBS0724]